MSSSHLFQVLGGHVYLLVLSLEGLSMSPEVESSCEPVTRVGHSRRMDIFFGFFPGFLKFFFPYCFCLFLLWLLLGVRSSRKGRGRSAKASVMERKGGNSGLHWFRVSLGSVSCP